MQKARELYKAILAHNKLTLPSDEQGQLDFILMFTDKPVSAQQTKATGSLLLQLWERSKQALWAKGDTVPDV